MNSLKAILLASLLALPAVACGVDDVIENTITCSDVCGRYADCFDDDYDVVDCVERCEDDATADDEKEERLETCDACMDDESCTSAVFECTTECVEFVP